MAEKNVAIKVENVSKTFKLPHEKKTSIKSAVINFYRRNKSYEKQKALKDVSFEINKGEFFGIVGRNGSGKSTLLKMLAGIYAPSKGSILINGKLTPFIELGVGFNGELTGRENVYLNGALLGFSRKQMDQMYDDIVEFSEIGRFMDQKLKNYSSGMQVRLAFSVAIQAQSDILLLDEVLAVGDAAFQQKCYTYFEKLKQNNKTVVFVSHDMSAVSRFCNRAVYLKDSKLILDGTPTEIVDLYREENMESSQKTSPSDKKRSLSKKYSLSAKIVDQTEKIVGLQLSYSSKDDSDIYVGISLLKDGVSVAEIATSQQNLLNGTGKVTYYLEKSLLNGGLYQFGAGLFRKENTELIAVPEEKVQFVVKGVDDTRGAALKLADTWKYE